MADDLGRRFADRFAAAVNAEPLTDAEVDQVLALAGDAAHASERLAAPLVCWIAGRAGVSLDEARAAVSSIG